MRSLMLRLAGFTGAPVLSALAPFIILPVVSRIVGDDGWANFSSGQAIGILGMVGVLFGWGVIGPVRVARATSAAERAVILHESIRSRIVASAVAVPLAALATFVVCSPSYRLESVAVAVAMTLGGLTPAWFCIGEGRPRDLMLFDAAPKLAASALSFPVLLLTGDVLWYPVILVVLTLPAFAAHAHRSAHRRLRGEEPPRGIRTILKSLVPTATIDATGNAYGSTAIPIATAGLVASEASAFASADRVYRVAIMAVIAFGNAFQAWALDPTADDPRSRHRRAVIAHVALGILGGTAIAALAPVATAIIFGATVAAAPGASLFYGVAFLFLSTTTPMVRNLLIPAARFRLVFAGTLTAALVGIAVMVTGSTLGSGTLVALGLAASEATFFVVLVLPARRAYAAIGRPAEERPQAPTT
ncbi:polysaccharide biosynthesis protein [Microbacterium enclense]|uniref:polysaccharide biosynthesis protein n=1 Tax=Microbacterium enclense TaxID=993073 RepID=UPI003F7FE835